MLKKIISVVCSQTKNVRQFFRRHVLIHNKKTQDQQSLGPDPGAVKTDFALLAKTQSESNATAAPSQGIGSAPKSSGGLSFESELSRVLSEFKPICTRATWQTYQHAASVAVGALPEHVRNLPLGELKREDLLGLRDRLSRRSPASREQLGRFLKRFIRKLIECGLSPDCADVLDMIPQRGDLQRLRRQISDGELATMVRCLPGESSAIQLLFWLGFSGGMRLCDAVALRRDNIDPTTGRVRYQSPKNGTNGEFFLVKDGLDCFKKRRYAKNERFVFPEFVCPGN